MIQKNDSRFRWYMLFLAMLTYGAIAGAARLCMPVLFPEIAADLDLSLFNIGVIWGMDPLAGVFIGLPAGLLVDRFGIKRTLTIVCILAGVFGAVRGFSTDFATMAASMFLFGLVAAIVPSVAPKVAAVWFTGKRLALANGMLNVAWSFGAVIATLSSATLLAPWLGGWRNVLFFFGVPPVLIGGLWWFTGRDPKRGEAGIPETATTAVTFKQAISHVFRLKNVWLLGFMLMCYWGANMGFSGYLQLYLEDIGWEPAAASGAMTLFSGFGMLGVMPLVILSTKIRSRKTVMLFCIATLAVTMAMVPFASSGGVWGLIVIGGLLRAAPPAIGNTLLFEMKEVGGKYAGTAIGLTNTLGMLGAFISPPIGNSLASIDSGAPILFWAAMGAMAIPLILAIKERKIEPDRIR